MGRRVRPIRVEHDERKCRVYGILQNEYHFLIECPVYCNLKTMYVKRYHRVNPSIFKLELVSTNNKRDIKNLATYVYKAFDEKK